MFSKFLAKRMVNAVTALAVWVFFFGCIPRQSSSASPQTKEGVVKLPEPKYDHGVSIEQALRSRRSVRQYTGAPLSLQQASQLLWAAQGITDPKGLRTAPSAGGTYPLTVYLIAGDVNGLAPGVYRYRPHGHTLDRMIEGDPREKVAAAALNQRWVQDGAAVIVLAADYDRTTRTYGQRGVRYVHMEAGHAAQNIYLQAAALDLGTVAVGAFHDDRVKDILGLPEAEQPLYIMPVGRE